MSSYSGLETIGDNDVRFFTIEGDHKAKVVKVYDGDTVHAILDIFGAYYKFKVRLDGIDTPEIRTKDLEEKTKGLDARDWLSKRIMGKIVDLKCKGMDKYGRLLADIYVNDTCINTEMITNNIGYEYHGGTKNTKSSNE